MDTPSAARSMYPPPAGSDDSAVESMSSGPPSTGEQPSINNLRSSTATTNGTATNNVNHLPHQTNGISKQTAPPANQHLNASAESQRNAASQQQHQQQRQPQPRPKITRPQARDLKVCSEELATAALQMRRNNSCLLNRSTRTVLGCLDDLELCRFGDQANYLINFISNGSNTNPAALSRPVSCLWPDTYERLVEQVATLDAYLLSINFKEKPVAWLLENNLTMVPRCKHCQSEMNLHYGNNTVRWQCLKRPSCARFFMPVQRHSFFNGHEKVSLDKLLFSIYYWATCTPADELYTLMKIEPAHLDAVWRRLQGVCYNLLEKKYPRLRLTDSLGDDNNQPATNESRTVEPVDLISIKLNELYVVCGKHPRSNLVRLGLLDPDANSATLVRLTQSWFAHGTNVRIAERKFLPLASVRTDLKVKLVSRTEMISKEGRFNRDSAFGYIICQLSHVLKDSSSSSTLTPDILKLLLAEMEWREIYGSTPFDAFSNIVAHIADYGDTSHWMPKEPETKIVEQEPFSKIMSQHTAMPLLEGYQWTEQYYYANVDPIDSDGKVICRFVEPPDPHRPSDPVAMIRCHECDQRFESFDFSFHIASHVELNRHENEREEYKKRSLVECKHCFKTFPREQLLMHKTLLRSHLHMVRHACRICCILLNNRTDYLNHMQRFHFKHETPYRCPSCPFASSFQRDVYIHFQEEHRHAMIILCPICLRSFTVKEPEKMTKRTMGELSIIVYNHIAEHYVISKSLRCNNCCLSFLTRSGLALHKANHHNPREHRPTNVRLEEFVVTPEEEEYCVKAKHMSNQLAILTPLKRPARCLECFTVVTTDHFLAAIDCKDCKYRTHCPRAALTHTKTMHMSA